MGSWNHAEDPEPHQRVTAKRPSRVRDSDMPQRDAPGAFNVQAWTFYESPDVKPPQRKFFGALIWRPFYGRRSVRDPAAFAASANGRGGGACGSRFAVQGAGTVVWLTSACLLVQEQREASRGPGAAMSPRSPARCRRNPARMPAMRRSELLLDRQHSGATAVIPANRPRRSTTRQSAEKFPVLQSATGQCH